MHKCTAGWPSRKSARERAPAPISSQFHCPRPTWLVCLADQNRHATQAMLSVKHLRLRNLSAKAYRHIGCKINGLTLSLDDATDISQDIRHLVSAASLYDPRVTKFLTSSTLACEPQTHFRSSLLFLREATTGNASAVRRLRLLLVGPSLPRRRF